MRCTGRVLFSGVFVGAISVPLAGKKILLPATLDVDCRNRLCEGDSVTRLMAAVLFVTLGLATFAAPIAVAKTSSVQTADQASQAKARKDYLKQQKKQRKNAKKSIKKDQKQWKKQHPKTS
jgi:hypothetical protein